MGFGAQYSALTWSLAIAWVFFSASALGTPQAQTGVNSVKSASDVSQYDFRFAIEADPISLDPARATGINEGQLVDNLYEGLVEYPAGDGELVPGVAERWEVSADGLVYTFHLRVDARWSDGRVVSAQDFRRSWLRLLKPRNARSHRELLYIIQGAQAYGLGRSSDPNSVAIEVVSPSVLRVVLASPAPYFLELCAFSALRPVAEGQEESAFGPQESGRLVTNGPYRLESWRAGERLTLSKNLRYWGHERVRLSWVSIEPVKDNDDVVRRYLSGRLDWTGTVDLPVDSVKELARREDYRESPSYGTYYLRLNTQNSALADNRVRRALTLSVDRQSISSLVSGGVRPAAGFVPPTKEYKGGDGRLEWTPKAARTLWGEARGGDVANSLTLLINDQPNHRHIARHLVADWKRVLGVTVRIDAVPWPEYLRRINAGKFQMARAGWLGDYQDPMTFLELWGRGHTHNTTRWFDREYTGLLEKARRAKGPAARATLLTEAESILLKRGPVVPLFFYARSSLLSPRVRGFVSNRLGHHLLKYLAVE